MPWTLFETSLGTCGIAWSDAGIASLQLPERTPAATEKRLLTKTQEAGPRATPRTTPAWVKEAMKGVQELLDGRRAAFTGVPLDLSAVGPFDAKVYRALRTVPAGATTTYGELARAVGSPGAARAVGRAMATNPIPILVPCHRVLAAGNKPGGFSAYGGLVTKERILVLEGHHEAPTLPLFAAKPRAGTANDGANSPGRAAGPAAPMASVSAGRSAELANALPYDAAAAVRHLAAADPVLADHLESVGAFGLTLAETESTFAALAQSIVYQQLNGKAAATIFTRVRALFPRGKLDPKTLMKLPDDVLRGAGLSRNKLAALRDLAERSAEGTIPTLPQLTRMTDDAIVAELTKVRGIGRWTVEMLLIFRLGRPDVLPVADFGIRKGFARAFHRGKQKDELPTGEAVAKRGERWRPFRSVASWYLWRIADGAA